MGSWSNVAWGAGPLMEGNITAPEVTPESTPPDHSAAYRGTDSALPRGRVGVRQRGRTPTSGAGSHAAKEGLAKFTWRERERAIQYKGQCPHCYPTPTALTTTPHCYPNPTALTTTPHCYPTPTALTTTPRCYPTAIKGPPSPPPPSPLRHQSHSTAIAVQHGWG